MNLKPQPNHAMYLAALRRLTPEQRLRKTFELSEFAKTLFLHGLRRRFPDASDAEVRRIARERLDQCHNRNY